MNLSAWFGRFEGGEGNAVSASGGHVASLANQQSHPNKFAYRKMAEARWGLILREDRSSISREMEQGRSPLKLASTIYLLRPSLL